MKQAIFKLNMSSKQRRIVGDHVLRRGKCFEVGEWDFPWGKFSVTSDDLDNIVKNFTPVDNVDEHFKGTYFSGKLGYLAGVEREGNNLIGTFAFPLWFDNLHSEDEPIKVSLGFNGDTKKIIHNAITHNPRIDDAAALAAFSSAYSPLDDDDDDDDNVDDDVIESKKSLFKRLTFPKMKKATMNNQDKELEALKENISLQNRNSVVIFAQKLIEQYNNKILPIEREHYCESIVNAILQDANGTLVTFSAQGEINSGGDNYKKIIQLLEDKPELHYYGESVKFSLVLPEADQSQKDKEDAEYEELKKLDRNQHLYSNNGGEK